MQKVLILTTLNIRSHSGSQTDGRQIEKEEERQRKGIRGKGEEKTEQKGWRAGVLFSKK